MNCKNPLCRRILGVVEAILATAVGGHCTDCAIDQGLFKEVE